MKSRTIVQTVLLLAFVGFNSTAFPQYSENIYAHLDKEVYLPGEDIWFKAYVFENGKPSINSTTLYAGLYNAMGNLLAEKQYPLFDGCGAGNFKLSDSVETACLQLRMFTKNMLSADSGNVYLRNIIVYDKTKLTGNDVVKNKNISIEFFPEGGTLVADINNFIIYKANNAPANFSASITDTQGTFIDSIFFDANGSAKNQFTPIGQKKYLLNWREENKVLNAAFPLTVSTGAVLHTEVGNNTLYYFISKNNISPTLTALHLYILSAGDTLLQQTISFKNTGKFINKISLDSLTSGILSFFLIDEYKNVLQKKQVLVDKKLAVPVVNISKNNTGSREKITLEISIPDTIFSQFSASVIDDNFYFPHFTSAISDGLLMNKQGSFLYNAGADEKQKDLVLAINEVKYSVSKTIEKENYLDISVNTGNKDLPENSLLSLIINSGVAGKEFLTLQQITERSFYSDGLVFFDSAKIYYEVSGRKDLRETLNFQHKNFLRQPDKIKFDCDLNLMTKNAGITPTLLNEIEENYWSGSGKFNEEQILNRVIVKSKYVNPVTKRLQQLDDKYATGLAKGMARGTQINVLDDNTATFSDIFSYIIYRVGGLKVEGSFGSRRIVSNRPESGGALLVFIDDIPSDYEQLENTQMSQVAYIKVIQGIVITIAGSTNTGVIYVYRKRGDEDKSASSMKWQMVKGYNLADEFKMPDYSQKKTEVNKDYRTTLYWNPYIFTDKNNRTIRIEYYNNDISKRQVLILQGVNENGQLTEIRKIIQ